MKYDEFGMFVVIRSYSPFIVLGVYGKLSDAFERRAVKRELIKAPKLNSTQLIGPWYI